MTIRPRHRALLALMAAAATAWDASDAHARSLSRVIPELFGGSLGTTIDLTSAATQEPLLAERFRNLPAVLAAARTQAPIPSATGAFRFAWDPDLDTFVRSEQSLGPALAERGLTLGKGMLTFGFSYSHSDFDSLEGDNLSAIRTRQPAQSPAFLMQLPESDRQRFGDDVIETQLDLSFKLDVSYLVVAYGLSDDVDLSAAITINRVRMRGRAMAVILDPEDNGSSAFGIDQSGVIRSGTGPICSLALRCAEDAFEESATGTGDIYLRGKWNFANPAWADLAVAGVLTVPTGNGSDLLGFNDPTFTAWLIASRSYGRVSPHLNIGYAFRSGRDGSQLQWIAGADARIADGLTLAADFLGYHDDNRDGSNDDVMQAAVGFKLNPIGNVVLGTTLQFPLNRDGLRADIVYSGQIEYTF